MLSGLKKNKNTNFPFVKMAVNYAKMDRVGSLDADFQQVILVQ